MYLKDVINSIDPADLKQISQVEITNWPSAMYVSLTVAKMETCDVLCIDDLGAEYTTEAATYQIVNLLEERMSWSRPTVITTNLTDKELLQRYGQRFVSRIHENFFKLVYTGEDMRLKK